MYNANVIIQLRNMGNTLVLVDWKKEHAESRAKELEQSGWSVVTECNDGGRAYRLIKEILPDVVLIDLTLRPSHGIEVGKSLRQAKALAHIPILFVDGTTHAMEAANAKVSGARFCEPSTLLSTLKRVR
jgi:CheY-like chemotaxis protein